MLLINRLRGVLLVTSVVILGSGCQSEPARQPVHAEAPALQATQRCAAVEALNANQHFVTSWRTAPTDALITHPISGLTVRQSLAPHWSGEVLRLKFSNRFSQRPLTIENVHIAREATRGLAEMVPGTACRLSFAGQSRVTIAPGETLYSDLLAYPVQAFERVGISFYAPEFTPQITRHLNANEFLYNSVPGDFAAEPSGAAFQQVPDGYASNFLAIEALEVAAATAVATIVTVGDSITDGSGASTSFLAEGASPMTASDQRYPNHLQQRILEAGLPYSVANAGIGGNELLNDGWLPQFGVRLLSRLDHDVLQVTAATHVLAMIGTNDFGNPKPQLPTAEQMITGYRELIERVHSAGLAIILGTIPPAAGAVTEGIVGELPLGLGLLHGSEQARAGRDAVNAWIRQQNLSDGVVDFAACLEDPQRPGYLAPVFNSGDNLHPSPAGYAAMADCVDLELFQ